MKIKKISINNIRSYSAQAVEFPEGSTLLSGDIGSGKTSILLAIEFALFGLQPGQRGSSLLKNGETSGGVVLDFEIDGIPITIERRLKKGGKSIAQDYCSITIDGDKTEAAVTEIKDKVLELLAYPKEFAKKQNLLYKFTVYTPQEEMKQIILEDAETRINTLRHVFGVDKYKKIIENVSILITKLREEKRIKQALTANIEQEKIDLVQKEEELETKHYNLVSVEKELFSKAEKKKKVQDEKEEVSIKVEEKNKLSQEIEKTRFLIINKNELTLGNEKSIKLIEQQLKELKDLKFDESKIIEIEKNIESLKKEKTEINEKNIDITSKINSLVLKNQESESIKIKITKIDICPTCLQNVDYNYKANIKNKFDSDMVINVKDIDNLTLEKKAISEKLRQADVELTINEKKLQDLKILKFRVQETSEKQKRLDDLKAMNESLKKDINLLNQHTETLRTLVFDLNRYENLYEAKKKELELALKEERIAEIKVAELKKEIEVFSSQIDEIKDRLKKSEKIQKDLSYISELESWLSKQFVPVISFIEKNVMIKLKSEFSKLFQEWFSMLVSENFNAKLDDNFTPIIEQQDYEIDYAYLSGGERTAVALAYRLALTQVINSLMSKIKTHDLVILDEPTDGFSEQQLDKMREVLYQLNVKQLIIVSHEQKIEGFVENIIRFKKTNGLSGIA
ncbi:AAA family ATPase [Candidatus Pacearchaeota archaeon]|nr:AAA family ATPase [Candidatus Pacearchaeota archaeon]